MGLLAKYLIARGRRLCPWCYGSGFVMAHPCPKCRAAGEVRLNFRAALTMVLLNLPDEYPIPPLLGRTWPWEE